MPKSTPQVSVAVAPPEEQDAVQLCPVVSPWQLWTYSEPGIPLLQVRALQLGVVPVRFNTPPKMVQNHWELDGVYPGAQEAKQELPNITLLQLLTTWLMDLDGQTTGLHVGRVPVTYPLLWQVNNVLGPE